jgi:cell division protein FtsI (penicillin-binding protein 3)
MLQRYQKWGSYSIGSISMGQEVGVTPVQMVTAVSAIANGGLLYKPHVVQEIRRGEQTIALDAKPSAPAEPKRVVRPETAATMRRLMEGVVLLGTGKAARLDGWTAAGKTGTAQKTDPETGRYSAHNVIASFTGFAPINNPAVTILVSIDSPQGWPHDGGSVAAPVFKRIAEQVLPYLNVAQDVPLSPKMMLANYRGNAGGNNSSDAPDDLAPVDFQDAAKTEVTAPAAAKTEKAVNPAKAPEVTVVLDQSGEITVPDFRGKTMREVTEGCLRLGLEPVLVGSSLATQQSPAAGEKLRRGAKVTVEFAAGNLRTAKAR